MVSRSGTTFHNVRIARIALTMTARGAIMLMAGGALGLVALSFIVGKTPLFIWNSTASVPRGLYVVTRTTTLHRGDFVSAWLPFETRRLADQRRYLPATVPIIKPIAALAGDTVCATGRTVSIDGAQVATRLVYDHENRPMPAWIGCKNLTANEVLLLSTHSPDSFDGRYFGPTVRAEIIAVLRPLWTF